MIHKLIYNYLNMFLIHVRKKHIYSIIAQFYSDYNINKYTNTYKMY